MMGFAGWEMPVWYDGVVAEHMAVRRAAGVFDVSHMGQVEVRGPDAMALLQRLLSGDLRRLPEGGAQYGLICDERGGILDDVLTYRLAERHFLTVTNAANHERDLGWFLDHASGFDVDVRDRREEFAMLAVQGPESGALLARLADGPLPPRNHCCQRTIAGLAMLVCATGYTGEAGVELMLDPAGAGAVWDALVGAGAHPAGLGARDTLRLEAGLPLHGNDIDERRNPIEAGLGWACAEQTGFIGAEAVAAAREPDPSARAERLVCFEIAGRGIARQGDRIEGGGVVTSGGFSPCLERGIGMAYVPADRSAPGTELVIDVRGAARRAVVRAKPIYRKEQ